MKYYTRNRCRRTMRLICVGLVPLASSVARADVLDPDNVLDPDIVVRVPPGDEVACGSWVNFKSDYLDSLQWLKHTGIGSSGQTQRILALYKASVEIRRNDDGSLTAKLVMVDDEGAHEQIVHHPPMTECSFAASDAADLTAHFVLGRSREPQRLETDYEVTIQTSPGAPQCNDTRRFRWFFERARIDQRFAPRHPRKIALDIQGDLARQVRANVTIWPAHEPGTSLQPELSGEVKFQSEIPGQMECTNVLRAAARDIVNKTMPGDPESLIHVAPIREAKARPRFFVGVGPVATLMVPLSSSTMPAFGISAALQHNVTKRLDLSIFMNTYQQQYIHLQRATAQLEVFVPELRSYGGSLCGFPSEQDRSVGLCAGVQVNEWVARGVGLKYPKQGTDTFGSANWRVFYKLMTKETMQFQVFVGGHLMIEPLQVETRRYTWFGPRADITGGILVMIAPSFDGF